MTQFPSYIHSVIDSTNEADWPVQAQGENECGCTVAANALNILVGQSRFLKDDFVRQAGVFFNRKMGGTPSPITEYLVKQHGFGTHFGNLTYTDAEAVLRDLIRRKIPVVVELGENKIGKWTVFGEHSILLVGYSDPYQDHTGVTREEYYFVDSMWPELYQFRMDANNIVANGKTIVYPGNRTMSRDEFWNWNRTRIYFPIFPTQAEHDAWYQAHMRQLTSIPVIGWLQNRLMTGTYDSWVR
jgi:hypothetical protein